MGQLYRRKPGGPWHADFTDAHGKRHRRSTGTPVKQLAAKILLKWQNDAVSRRHRVADDDVSLELLIAEYLAYLGNTSDKHRKLSEMRIRSVLGPHGWSHPEQITQYAVESTVRQLVHPKTGKRLALRTQSHYLTAVKSFTRWLVLVRQVLVADPLLGVKKPRWDADRRLIRRFLRPDEWFWLKNAEHSTLYETAIQTGLRLSEIRAVGPEHLRTDHIELPAEFTKNKKTARQFITPELHSRLAEPGVLPFQVANYQRLAQQLARDLESARTMHLDEGPSNKPAGFLSSVDSLGHVLDFHSLRHTCGAWLALAGVQPKVIQSVMRHSSIVLTLDTYGHLFPGAEKDAVEHFRRLLE